MKKDILNTRWGVVSVGLSTPFYAKLYRETCGIKYFYGIRDKKIRSKNGISLKKNIPCYYPDMSVPVLAVLYKFNRRLFIANGFSF